MLSRYPLFQSHLDLAHRLWQSNTAIGDTVIDATCGNGQDTLMLCKLALTDNAGSVYAIDIQPSAIQSTQQLLQDSLPGNHLQRVKVIQGCHSVFPRELADGCVKLIVYNLGYLPGGDKSITTRLATTLDSLQGALRLVRYGGMISVTCYPGHPEGKHEEDSILAYSQGLDPREWSCCHHKWINRRQSPSLLLLQRKTHD